MKARSPTKTAELPKEPEVYNANAKQRHLSEHLEIHTRGSKIETKRYSYLQAELLEGWAGRRRYTDAMRNDIVRIT